MTEATQTPAKGTESFTQKREVMVVKAEVIYIERALYSNETETPWKYFQKLKQNCLLLAALGKGMKIEDVPEGRNLKVDLAKVETIRGRVLNARTPVTPNPHIQIHEDGTYEFSYRRGDPPIIVHQDHYVEGLEAARNHNREIHATQAIDDLWREWSALHDILAEYGIYDADTSVSSAQTGYERQHMKAGLREEKALEKSRDEDDDDDE